MQWWLRQTDSVSLKDSILIAAVPTHLTSCCITNSLNLRYAVCETRAMSIGYVTRIHVCDSGKIIAEIENNDSIGAIYIPL